MSNTYASAQDIIDYGRALTQEELTVCDKLLPAISAQLRLEADRRGYDLDSMATASEDTAAAAKTVAVQVAIRYLNQGTTDIAMSNVSQAAGGYSVSGTYLVPGGGIFIKRAELASLGILRQRFGGIDIYGADSGD